MRIAMVTPRYHPKVGGLETSVRLLSTWLAARGHEVTVHTSAVASRRGEVPPSEVLDGVRIRRYSLRLNLGYFRSVFRPEVHETDVVHLHGYGVLTNDFTARRVRWPLVYSLLHGVSMPHPTRWTRFQRVAYDHLLGLRTLRRVDAIVALNQLDLSWLAARGIRHARVLETPIPPDAFVPGDPSRARARFGTERFVLYVGRLHREKGVVDLVKAIADVPKVQAWFAGPDDGAAGDIERSADHLGVRDRVRILGEVEEGMKRDLLAACEFLVLPSTYEAQGIVVAEAWAQRKAVVASRAGALVDWVEDGRTGVLVPPGRPADLRAAIERLLGDPNRAQAMGMAGASRSEALRLERLGPEFEALYRGLSERAGRQT